VDPAPITGRISFDAALLSIKNKQRDKHLRSADFFDAETTRTPS
jgi:polyisoprenoid-binding protein YceI